MKERGRNKYFTRHLLRIGLQCPAKLYYKARGYPEDQSIRPFLEHAGFNKYHLKKLAGRQYSDAVRVREKNREKAVQKTVGHLEKENIILSEASFIFDNCYCKVPLLLKTGQSIELIDVQTKVYQPGKHRLTDHHGSLYQKWRPYIVDLAYKQFVIQSLFPGWQFITTLLLPQKTSLAQNDKLLQQLQNEDAELQDESLFSRLNVTPYVKQILNERGLGDDFEKILISFKIKFFEAEWEQPSIGRKCANCEFKLPPSQVALGQKSGFHKCWSGAKEVPGYPASELPVLDLLGPGINDWLANDTYLQNNIDLEELPAFEQVLDEQQPLSQKHRQTLHIRKIKNKQIPREIVKQPVFEEIRRWEYPLHFLDFEAGNYAVPIRKNRKPYHLVVFQFSCHTLHADGSWFHHQWLDHLGDDYPNFELIRQLQKVPNIQEGTVVQYSKFEHFALKTIRKELRREQEQVDDAADLIEWLNGMVERHDSNHPRPPYLADISRLVKNYYYNRFMENSLSIKDVLQSVLTVSDFLREKYSDPYNSSNFDAMVWWQWNEKKDVAENPYTLLRNKQKDLGIGRGTEAMVLYGKILTNSLRSSEKNEAKQALLKYCELDTLAMVMIYEHWQNLSDK